VEWIAERERFAAIRSEWDRLAARQPTPFLLSAWLEPWLEAFAPRRGLRVAVLWRGDELAAGAPLLAGLRQWRAATNDHSPAFGLPAADEAALERLVAELIAAAGGLVLPALDEADPVSVRLRHAASGAGRLVRVEPMHRTLRAATARGLEAYLRAIPSKRLSEVRRLRRKAAREHGLDVRAVAVPDDPGAALERLVELEARGWKGRAGSAIACDPATARFYRHLAERFHAAGALRISELRLDGRTAAIEFGILHRGWLFTPKSAYDEGRRSLGPGMVLQLAAIERCFELGLEGYDFTGPAYDYERPFANGERGCQRLRIHRRDPLGAGRQLYHRFLRPALRRAYRATRGRNGTGARRPAAAPR